MTLTLPAAATETGPRELESGLALEWDLGLGPVRGGRRDGRPQAGEVASHMAVEAVVEFVVESATGSDMTWPFPFEPAIRVDANRLLTARAGWPTGGSTTQGCGDAALEGMGTTIVAVSSSGDRVVLVARRRQPHLPLRATAQLRADDERRHLAGRRDRRAGRRAGPVESPAQARADQRASARARTCGRIARGGAAAGRPAGALQRRHSRPPRRRRHCRRASGRAARRSRWHRRWSTRRWPGGTSDNATALVIAVD